MGNILNAKGQLRLFRGRYDGNYFVDKSEILEKLNSVIGKVDEQYICITRPRRFGKTVMTNLISSYYAKGLPSKEIFDTLKISKNKEYEKHLNQHNVISLYMSDMPFSCDSYKEYIQYFKTGFQKLENRQEILSVMIIYSFLAYYDSYICIPNKELMRKFENVMEDNSMGYIATLAQNSNAMLEATLARDTKKMEEILEYVHNTEIPILQYNDENSLSCIVNLIYLNARDKYRIEREEKAAKGFVDFIFYPLNAKEPAIILELKKDDTPEHAIAQIMDRKYYTRFVTCKGGEIKYNQNVLVVGMAYDKASGTHRCKVKQLEDLIGK